MLFINKKISINCYKNVTAEWANNMNIFQFTTIISKTYLVVICKAYFSLSPENKLDRSVYGNSSVEKDCSYYLFQN